MPRTPRELLRDVKSSTSVIVWMAVSVLMAFSALGCQSTSGPLVRQAVRKPDGRLVPLPVVAEQTRQREAPAGEVRQVNHSVTPEQQPANRAPDTQALPPAPLPAEAIGPGFQEFEAPILPPPEDLPPQPDEPLHLDMDELAVADPPVAPGALSFNQVIDQTLAANPEIRAGLQWIREAQGDAVTAWLLPNPEVNVWQTLLPLGQGFIPDEREGGPPQLDVEMTYPIDWFLFGKRAAAIVTANYGVRVSQAEYANLVRETVRDAGVAYYDVIEAKWLIELAIQDVANLERVETITREAVEVGGFPRVELQRVQLDLLSARQTLREARLELVRAKAELRALLGRSDADPEFDVVGSLALPGEPLELPLDEAYQIAMENRPDIQALRMQVAEARADAELQYRERWPEVAPGFVYTRQHQEQAIGQPDVSSWGAGVGATIPVFNRNQGNRIRAQAMIRQTQFDYRAGTVNLRAEIIEVVQELVTAMEIARSVEGDQLRLAIEVRESLNEAYQMGGRPLIDILDAQRNYRETYTLYINSRADYWRARVRFHAAIATGAIQ